MSDKPFDLILPSFRPRDAQNKKKGGGALWNQDQSNPNNATSYPEEHIFMQMPSAFAAKARNETLFSSPLGANKNQFNTHMLVNSTLETPPRASPRKLDAYNGSTGGIPGLLPDDSMGDTFTVELEESAEEVIASLKLQVETLITAIMLDSPNSASESLSSSSLQGTDAIEVAHRIMTRLRLLREENDKLAQMATGSLNANLEAKNARLMEENEALKTQLADIQKKKRTVGA